MRGELLSTGPSPRSTIAPVVLPQDVHAAWLDRKLTDAHQVKAIADARMPPEQFTHYKVRLLVNDTNLNGPELIEPLES